MPNTPRLTKKYPAISDPIPDPENLRKVVMEIKEVIEVLQGDREPRTNSAVSWQHLIDLGLATEEDIPR